jgi:hypothetical protein
MSRKTLALSIGLAAIAGCADNSTAPPPSASNLNGAQRVGEWQAQYVARGISQALVDPVLRGQLVRAMSESEFSEHKLTLQQYMKTGSGARLKIAAAKALHTNVAELAKVIAALPELDLYLPFRAHRISMRAAEARNILVAAAFDGDVAELKAFDTDGGQHILRLSDGTPIRPLLMLHPAEPKARIARRHRPHADRVEETGEPIGGIIQANGESGPLSIEDCENTEISCDPEGGGGGGGGSIVTEPGVYITHFHFFQEDGWFGDLELEFHSRVFHDSYPQFNGQAWVTNDCEKGGATFTYPPHQNWIGTKLLSPGITNVTQAYCDHPAESPRGYWILIKEMDGGLNGSWDNFGRRFFVGGTQPFGAVVGLNEEYRCDRGFYPDPACGMVKTEYR